MGKLLEDFIEAADELRPEAFTERYSPGFLVIHGESTSPGFKPVTVEFRNQITDSRGQAVEISALLMSEVYDLSIFAERRAVSIGRGLDVDLFLSDPTVSRLHATLTWSKSGRVYLQHAGGSSPTLVNQEAVPSQMESAIEVPSGAMVHVGSVRLSYLSPPEFQKLVWRLASQDKAIST